MNIIEIFPKTYVIEFQISDNPNEVTEKLNPYLSSVGKNKIPYWSAILNQDEFLSLKEKFFNCVKEYNEKFQLHKKKIEITNSWFNVMSQDSGIRFHSHKDSLLSGVYYPNLPEGSLNLSFISSKKEKTTLPIKEGHLYIFPSMLEHGSSNTNKCDNRIVISFDTYFCSSAEKIIFKPHSINLIEIFPKIKVLEFELSHDPKEIVEKLKKYMSDNSEFNVTNRVYADSDNSIAGAIERQEKTENFEGSSHSPFGSILNQKEFLSLKNEINYCIKKYNEKYNTDLSRKSNIIYNQDCYGNPAIKSMRITNSWFNVMSNGSTLKSHMHEDSHLTGIYYPSFPEGSANLSIVDPKFMLKLVEDGKELKHIQPSNYFDGILSDTRERITLPLKEGHLYIFPSWLEHGTTEINKCDNRVAMSFNATEYQKKQQIEHIVTDQKTVLEFYNKYYAQSAQVSTK